jgi:hypothetical protein
MTDKPTLTPISPYTELHWDFGLEKIRNWVKTLAWASHMHVDWFKKQESARLIVFHANQMWSIRGIDQFTRTLILASTQGGEWEKVLAEDVRTNWGTLWRVLEQYYIDSAEALAPKVYIIGERFPAIEQISQMAKRLDFLRELFDVMENTQPGGWVLRYADRLKEDT